MRSSRPGSCRRLAEKAAEATGGNALLAVMLILGVSAVLSGFIDNIPYVATMAPLVLALTQDIPDPNHSEALWWALALGSDFGGNMTAIGASANVVALGIAARAGSPISFWEFSRKGAIVTVITVARGRALPLAALLRPGLSDQAATRSHEAPDR